MNETLDAAHDYIRRGFGVVPLYGLHDDGTCRCAQRATCPPKNRGKHPSLGNDWQTRPLTSGPDVEAWYEDHPHDNVGIATGTGSGIWVLDVDGPQGAATILDLVKEHGPLPATRVIRTGSGGLHYYWRHPGHFTVRNSSQWIGPGIDVRGAGGQVVAPPSVSGRGPYQLIADYAPADPPQWLTDLVHEHAQHCEAGRTHDVKAAERVDVEFLPPRVRDLASTLVGVDEGRHRHFYALVAAIREAGYSQGQAVTVAAPWCAAVDKYVGRVEAEVARSWGKLDAAADRLTWTQPTGTTPAAPQPQPEPAPEPAQQPAETAADEPPPTWRPVDLTAILAGTYSPETPALMPRADGQALIYPGRIHSFHGESESGKSLIIQAEAARLLGDGGHVLYIDFESDAPAVTGRILELGAPVPAIAERFTYLNPDVDPRTLPAERDALAAVLEHTYDLAVIDGVTDALGVFGAGSKDNDEVTAFMRALPRLLTRRTGAAVVLIDHVTKDGDNRGRFAIGGQAKMAALDGGAYVVEVDQPLGRGLTGTVVLRVAKDRPGGVRPNCGAFRKIDRTQEAARIVVDSTEPGKIVVTVNQPRQTSPETAAGEDRTFRPTAIMERISETLGRAPGPLSQTTLEDAVTGKRDNIRQALALLVAEGHVAVTEGPRRSTLHTLVRAYRQDQDPKSDRYITWNPNISSTPPDSAPTPPRAESVTAPPTPYRDFVSTGSGAGSTVDPGAVTPPQDQEPMIACRRCGELHPIAAKIIVGGYCPNCVGAR